MRLGPRSEGWWFVGGGEPSLVLSLFFGNACLVDGPLGGDAILALFGAGAVRRGIISPRPGPGSALSLRITARRRAGQDRKEHGATGFGRVDTPAGLCPDRCAVRGRQLKRSGTSASPAHRLHIEIACLPEYLETVPGT
jgi:hypothetical protein